MEKELNMTLNFRDEIKKLNLYIEYKPRTIYQKVSYLELSPEYIDEDGKQFNKNTNLINFVKKLPINTPIIDIEDEQIFKYDDHLPPNLSSPPTPPLKTNTPITTPLINIEYNKNIIVIGAGPVGLWFVISLLESKSITKIKSLTVLESRSESEYNKRTQQFFIENEFFNNLPKDIQNELDPNACRIFRPNRLIKSYCYKPNTVFPDEKTPGTSPDKNEYINGYSIMINKLQDAFKNYIKNQLKKQDIKVKFINQKIEFFFDANVNQINDKMIEYKINSINSNKNFDTLVISSGKIIKNNYGLKSEKSKDKIIGSVIDKNKLDDLYGAAINITTNVNLGTDNTKDQTVIDYFNNSDYQHRFRFFRQKGTNLYLGINLSKNEYEEYDKMMDGTNKIFNKGQNAKEINKSSTGNLIKIYEWLETIISAYTKINFAGKNFTINKGEFSIFQINLMSTNLPYVRNADNNNVYVIGDAVNSPHFFSMYGVNSGFKTANMVRDIIARNDDTNAQNEYKTFINEEIEKFVKKAIDVTIDFNKCVDKNGKENSGLKIQNMKNEMKQRSHSDSDIDFDKLSNVDICLMYHPFYKKSGTTGSPLSPPVANETIKVLTYNVSWEAMSANTNNTKINKLVTKGHKPSAKEVADICRETGKTNDKDNKCLINVAKIIEDSPELDFIGLQEATNWELIREKSAKLKQMKYIHHDLKKGGFRVEELVSFYNPKKFKFIAAYIGEVMDRPYQIIYLKHKVSLVIYAFINVHLPHNDVKKKIQEGFKFTTGNIYKLIDETKDAGDAKDLRIPNELTQHVDITALNATLVVANTNIEYKKNAFLNEIYNTKHIIFLGDTNDKLGNLYNNFKPFDMIELAKVKHDEFKTAATNFKGLTVSEKGTVLPKSCCNSDAIKNQKYEQKGSYDKKGDYILVSDKLNYVPGKENVILQTLLDENKDFENFPTSDHLPVYAEIKLPNDDILHLDLPTKTSTIYTFTSNSTPKINHKDLMNNYKKIYEGINQIYDENNKKTKSGSTWFPTVYKKNYKAYYYYLECNKNIYAVTARLYGSKSINKETRNFNLVDGKQYYDNNIEGETSGTAIMIDKNKDEIKYSIAFQELYYYYLNNMPNTNFTWIDTKINPQKVDEYTELGFDILYGTMTTKKGSSELYEPFQSNNRYYMMYRNSTNITNNNNKKFEKIECVKQTGDYYKNACGVFVFVNALMITFVAKSNNPDKNKDLLKNKKIIEYLTRYMRYVILKYAKYLKEKFPGKSNYQDFISSINVTDIIVDKSNMDYDDNAQYFDEMNALITDLYDFHWNIPPTPPGPGPAFNYFLNIDWLKSNIIIVQNEFDNESKFSNSIYCRNPIFNPKNLKIIRNFYKLNNFIISFIVGKTGHWTCYTVNKHSNAAGTIEKEYLFLDSSDGAPDIDISKKIIELLNKPTYEDFIIEILKCYSFATDKHDDKKHEKYISYINNMISLLLNDNVLKGKIPNYKDFVKKIITRIISVDIKYYNKSSETTCKNEIIVKLDDLMVQNKDMDVKAHYYNEIVRNKDIYSKNCIKNHLNTETKTAIKKLDNTIVIAGGARKLTKTNQTNQSTSSNQSKLSKTKYNKIQ